LIYWKSDRSNRDIFGNRNRTDLYRFRRRKFNCRYRLGIRNRYSLDWLIRVRDYYGYDVGHYG
jgi:hypothetical protein